MHSEKESLTRQLIGTSRLAELGEMAAGFAHEINNPLQIIKSEQSLIEVLFDELKADDRLAPSETLTELEDSINQIKLQITRCAKITQAILKFGRQSEPEVVSVDLHTLIPEVTKMIHQKASVHGIAFDQAVDPGPMTVSGDPAQLQQVIMNLLNNAIDAILARHGVSGGRLALAASANDDGTVAIQVKDNGCGIGPDNLAKIFSPFFTTKPVGEGTGLGLSVCYGIVESMGGRMQVSSQQGQGTTFTVTLQVAA
jgi:two-component system NtrC family sensor kinase